MSVAVGTTVLGVMRPMPVVIPSRHFFTLRAAGSLVARFRTTMLGVVMLGLAATFDPAAGVRPAARRHFVMESFHPFAELLHPFRVERRATFAAARFHLLAELLHPLVHFFHLFRVQLRARAAAESGSRFRSATGRQGVPIAVGSGLFTSRFVAFRLFAGRRFAARFGLSCPRRRRRRTRCRPRRRRQTRKS
jgi:hypothetical protein